MKDSKYLQDLEKLKKDLKGNLQRVADKAEVSLTYVGVVLSGDAINGDKVIDVLKAARELREIVLKEKADRMKQLEKIIA